MTDAAEVLKSRLRGDLKSAMQVRDAIRTSVLRTLIAAIDNAEAVAVDLSGPASTPRTFGQGSEAKRLVLDAGSLQAVVRREIETRQIALAEMIRLGLDDETQRLEAEASIVRAYLD